MAGYTLITGGAVGSDLYWQKKAMERGMNVEIMSFEEHKAHKASIGGMEAKVKVLSEMKLKEADELIRLANNRLKRKFPCQSEFSNNLIRRNYHIVKDAQAVLATGMVKNNQILGGTAWGVVIADLMAIDVYVFDIIKLAWYKYEQETLKRCRIPTLPKRFAGIGSRKLTPSGECAIDRVLDSTNESQ